MLILLVLLVGGGNLWNSYYLTGQVRAQAKSQQKQQDEQAAAQKKLGAVVEAKLCSSLAKFSALTDLRAPAGNPVDNPSRAFDQRLVLAVAPLAQLGPDIGCPAP